MCGVNNWSLFTNIFQIQMSTFNRNERHKTIHMQVLTALYNRLMSSKTEISDVYKDKAESYSEDRNFLTVLWKSD